MGMGSVPGLTSNPQLLLASRYLHLRPSLPCTMMELLRLRLVLMYQMLEMTR